MHRFRAVATLSTSSASSSLAAATRWCGGTPGKVKVTFVTHEGSDGKPPVMKDFLAPAGMTLMEVARSNRIDMEAACDGTCACSTCHVYLDKATYEALPKPSEDELDMLDLAPEVRPTSRLACQVELTAGMAPIQAVIPADIESQL
jgi:ferredoxin